MSGAAGGAAASGAAAAHAAIAQATKASGVIVRVEPREFATIVEKNSEPLVVSAQGGFWTKNHQYLTSYRGLAFFTKSELPMNFPPECEVVQAKTIWIPA